MKYHILIKSDAAKNIFLLGHKSPLQEIIQNQRVASRKTKKGHFVWQMAVAYTKVPLFKDPWHFQIKIKFFKKKQQGQAASDYWTPDYRTLTSSGLFPALRFIHINIKIVSFKVVFAAFLLVSKCKREHLLNKEKMFFISLQKPFPFLR